MTEIRVPTLGESVTEATIGRWFKRAGDPVAVDEPLVELETDKVTIEVPAPSAGTLGEIIAKDGETVAVGALLGQINDGAAAARQAPAKPTAAAAPPATAAPAVSKVPPSDAPACTVGAQAFGRKRHRCLDRSWLRQGWPRYQGRHAGCDREGGVRADPGPSACGLSAGPRAVAGR
jgi:pyruvate/2-oxoglutarate dehydrogenase complex dihydrolipoamide acyltransferase (E2) component